jgi:polyisoprenoid-binding protein YceI
MEDLMKKALLLAFALTLLFSAGPLLAADYNIDGAHSNLFFKVKHLGISTVTGKFNAFTGAFSFDEKNVTRAKVDVTIDINSINTENEMRDKHLKSPDFFDAAKQPKARFVSKKVSAMKDGHFQVFGDLTLKGVTKPVVLEADYSGSAKDPQGVQHAGFTATARINRQDFGIKWNKTLDNGGVMVSDEVKLELEIEGVVKTAGK